MKNERVIFDNGGGITVQLGDWAHWYNDPKQAAEDVSEYVKNPNTDDWDGHEDDAAELDPSHDDIRNGGYRIWMVGDDTNQDYRESWGNASDFFTALENR